jgi:uncharacterized membrane protein YccC
MDALIISLQDGNILSYLFVLSAVVAVLAALFRNFGYATIFAVIAVIVMLFTPANPMPWIWANKLTILTYTGIYLGVGIVWSVFAYILSVTKKARKYEELREQFLPHFLQERQITKLTEDHYSDFRMFMRNNSSEIRNMDLEFKTSDLAMEIALWPVQILTFFFGRMLFEVAKFVASRIGGLYQKIRRWAFRKFPEFQ